MLQQDWSRFLKSCLRDYYVGGYWDIDGPALWLFVCFWINVFLTCSYYNDASQEVKRKEEAARRGDLSALIGSIYDLLWHLNTPPLKTPKKKYKKEKRDY